MAGVEFRCGRAGGDWKGLKMEQGGGAEGRMGGREWRPAGVETLGSPVAYAPAADGAMGCCPTPAGGGVGGVPEAIRSGPGWSGAALSIPVADAVVPGRLEKTAQVALGWDSPHKGALASDRSSR